MMCGERKEYSTCTTCLMLFTTRRINFRNSSQWLCCLILGWQIIDFPGEGRTIVQSLLTLMSVNNYGYSNLNNSMLSNTLFYCTVQLWSLESTLVLVTRHYNYMPYTCVCEGCPVTRVKLNFVANYIIIGVFECESEWL
jgi:hypothetical protein